MEKQCYFCENNDYCQLQVHRIDEGKDGGKYTEFNTVVVCANDHCRIHNGQIVIDRKYYSTSGKWILHFWEDGVEFWR
jgi:hypothetical protein